jgi:hypothetical protein
MIGNAESPGYAPRTTTSRLIHLDDRLQAHERKGVVDAIDEWRTSVPEVFLVYKTNDHKWIMNGAKNPAGEQIYILRVENRFDPGCPIDATNTLAARDPQVAGLAQRFSGDFLMNSSARICLNAEVIHWIFSPFDESLKWKLVTMHEIGHALGMGHYNGKEPSVMYPQIDDSARHLTCRDIKEFIFLRDMSDYICER